MPKLSSGEVDLALREWASGLSPTRVGCIAVIEHLLRHAADDEMSSSDRAICVACLDKLRDLEGINPESPKRVKPPNCISCALPSHLGMSCEDAFDSLVTDTIGVRIEASCQ